MYHVAVGSSVNVFTRDADQAWRVFNAAIHAHVCAIIRRDGIVLDRFTAAGSR